MNIILLITEVFFGLITLIYTYKKYKYDGIYIWILILTILSGIMSTKVVEIFNLEINLGFALNSLILLAANILIQKKGPEEIKKVLSLVIFGNIVIYSFLVISTLILDSNINLITNEAYNQVFYLSNRYYFANIISLSIALWINASVYHQIRQNKNKILISGSMSTIIIHFIECLIFSIIAYSFQESIINIIELILIRYIFEVIIGLIGTSIIYISSNK